MTVIPELTLTELLTIRQRRPPDCFQTGVSGHSLGLPLKLKMLPLAFPGGPAVKNLPADAGDTGPIPVVGRPHMLQSN